uniref:E3 ubiquitin-protein ligase RNF26 n=1 Tax=Monopterus albus TaxID=43700 RepID=A0A3Q3ISJ8_MONAL
MQAPALGKCLDAVYLLLDLNFVIVHSLVRTLLAVIAFINSLPTLFLSSLQELGNFTVVFLMSIAEATSNVAHGTVTMGGSLVLALEGLLESLKMVGYLSMHVLLRGKEHLYRGMLSVLEGCSITVSLVIYFTNTVVNFALIATQNTYLAVVSVWQTVSSPLQKVLELTLTSFTFLYSCLVGTSAFLWSPCKMLLDFLVSLVHMFISVFILNINGLLFTAAMRIVDYMNSFPTLRSLSLALHQLFSALRSAPHFVRGNMRHVQRLLYHLYLLERGLWQQLSRHGSQLGLALQAYLHRDNNNRVRGDGDPPEERRDPPDGRAGDGDHQELLDLVFPSSSTNRPLEKELSSDKDSKPLPAKNLLSLLKEQEDRKKCVICQDCTKTVVLLPCRHLCLCRDCTNILLRQPVYQQNCPLCRHMILNTMDVYL